MVSDLKYFDGSLAKIDRVPAEMRELYATAFEVDADVDRRSRRAPPEVDRPGAEPQHLHGRRVGQEARRDLQARVGARPQDHVLPAHAGGDVGREVDRPGRRAERGVGVGRRRRVPRSGARRPRAAANKRARWPRSRRSSARSTTRLARPASNGGARLRRRPCQANGAIGSSQARRADDAGRIAATTAGDGSRRRARPRGRDRRDPDRNAKSHGAQGRQYRRAGSDAATAPRAKHRRSRLRARGS